MLSLFDILVGTGGGEGLVDDLKIPVLEDMMAVFVIVDYRSSLEQEELSWCGEEIDYFSKDKIICHIVINIYINFNGCAHATKVTGRRGIFLKTRALHRDITFASLARTN